MPDSTVQLLCAGDVHLGRRPSRVPIEEESLSVSHVWTQLIDTAVDRDVDVVVLTGDIVDAENKMYEAFGALERGIQRLLKEGVEVVAVAGNHDHDAFPRLVRSIEHEGFHLLGQGGTWETVQLKGGGSSPVQFVGWSFPDRTVADSPLADLDLSSSEATTIGVLHCEAGRTEGRYAPVEREALARTPVDAWLLGHIHAPNEHWDGQQLQLYPGSLQPLDPGEPGTHGAWLVEIGPAGRIRPRQLPLATLRYETLTVDLSDREEAEEVEQAVLETIREELSQSTEQWPRLQHVAYRLTYEGRTQMHQGLEEQARSMINRLEVPVDEATATIEGVEVQTQPDHDLEELAEGTDPPGVLAQLLLDLQEETNSPRVTNALRRADKAVRSVHETSGYAPLRRDSATQEPPTRDELRSLLLRQGYRLLDELCAPSS